MPQINICFLWHMHQPLYKDLVNGEYRLPWARLHALKDYFGMVNILEEFPEIHQTFNLVPSLLVQLKEYASGKAADPFLKLALKPAETLSEEEKEFVLRYFFQANEDRVVRRYPRYKELLFVMQKHEHNVQRAAAHFDASMLRDLQVLSQLAWFDENYLEHDAEITGLARKGRDYTLEDQRLIGEKESELLSRVLDVYRDFAQRGQIEISTSAYYHPILPLLCDSSIAEVAHPYLPLPAHFSRPQDAAEQLRRAREYVASEFGVSVDGLWPSEGAVSEDALGVASSVGFRWAASDSGVLARSLTESGQSGTVYQPYRWKRKGQEIDLVFRDSRLSDLIGFVYSRMDPEEAANHFIRELRTRCRPLLAAGRDALVAIILDGENAWENYFHNGRPFLRQLYSRLTTDREISALTISEGLARSPAEPLKQVAPGSWIDSNFDVWIGSEEDNLAWDHLSRARNMFDRVTKSKRSSGFSEAAKRAAWEELLVAEGSDWCWWYGPEHFSVNKAEFDELYREHLASAYRLLGEKVPDELNLPIAKAADAELHEIPNGLIEPSIGGSPSSRTEWANAGRYRVGSRSGAMHSQRSLIRELRYGSDGCKMFFRIELAESLSAESSFDFRIKLRNHAAEEFDIRAAQNLGSCEVAADLPQGSLAVAMSDVLEVAVSLSALHIKLGDSLFLHVDVFRDQLPVALLPASGELELRSGTMAAYAY